MPIDLTILGRRINPSRTLLLFGSGSSVPSGGPTSSSLCAKLAERFEISGSDSLQLADLATIIEARFSRRALVDYLRELLKPLSPARGILNLPDFEWAGLYTTNYDEIIEKSYARRDKKLTVVATNFDFSSFQVEACQRLYKLHGTINADVSLGQQDRMVLSGSDYDESSKYRETLYAKFTEQLFTDSAIIIGHSLADPDLRSIIEEALRIKKSRGAPGAITLLVHERDENQALIFESRGLTVCFAGIDEFFAELTKHAPPTQLVFAVSDNPLDQAREVLPTTVTVDSQPPQEGASLGRMFNGSPASYADIGKGWTFERDFADRLEAQLAGDDKRFAYVLGPAGAGKTTGVRLALARLAERDKHCWEHQSDLPLPVKGWSTVDGALRRSRKMGVLFIDDAHEQLHAINSLVELLAKQEEPALKLVLVSSKPQWNPRIKTPAIFSLGQQYEVGALSSREIESLLDVIEVSSEIAALVEQRFLGFSRHERRRRLVDRCKADMFVCMRNIFAFEAFDDIILREYADLPFDYQELYKKVSGMEAAGIRVHRQLVLRAIGLQSSQVSRYLDDLTGIIDEYTVSQSEGVYAWRVRHPVIADIIASRKLDDPEAYYDLLDRTVDNLNPSYRIEIVSMNEMCDPRKGLARIYDKRKQNVLLRKMISLAPRERVPRHRLITNLIALSDYEAAAAEIRLFENELRVDGPVQRYKIRLLLERAKGAVGLMQEDQASLVREAAVLAEAGVERFQDDKNLYAIYLEAGVAAFKYTGSVEIFARAKKAALGAYQRVLDPDLLHTIRKFERVEQRFEKA